MKLLKKIYHFLIAYAAYWSYGRPSRKLIIIGVTGTKGKSSTCRFIASVLEAGGYKVGLATTAEFQIAERRWLNTKKMSMLGRGQLQHMLRDMVKAGCQYAVVETSSEGILQYRHLGLNYDIAVFTNLGTEHHERHGGYQNLRRDKGKLFASLSSHPHKKLFGRIVKKISIINADDKEAGFFLKYKADEKMVYTTGRNNNFSSVFNLQSSVLSVNGDGTNFLAAGEPYQLSIPGAFNVYNALPAICVGLSQGISVENIRTGLANVIGIPGRMEFINSGQPYKVVIDYAHESMSLTALFTTLRTLIEPGKKIIGVVGSDGGGRDKQKRATMGAIAGELCDTVVITDVNCFDEDPKVIAEMLAVGARAVGKKDNENLFIETDRRKGIALALKLADPGDIVAITAKGTEPVMCIGNGQTIPWDDRTVTRELLAN